MENLITILIVLIVTIVISTLLVYIGWNISIADIFPSVREITLLEAFGVSLLLPRSTQVSKS